MAANTIPSPCPKSNLTRRAALHGAAAVGALALPAGVAVAATSRSKASADLAAIEAGYQRFQDIQAERERLDQIADELRARADQAVAPMLPPEPPIPPELDPYAHWNEGMGKNIVWWGTTPRKGKVGKIADAHMHAELEWRGAHNELLDGQPDYERSREIDAEREALQVDAEEIRSEVLATPTTSPRGLLIKLAIAIEARSVEDIETRFANPSRYEPFGEHVGEDLLPPLAADLRAMVGEARS